MRIKFLTIILACFFYSSNAQTKPTESPNPYAASTISKALLTQQANVVFREFFESTDLTNPSKTKNSVRLVATILREDGRRWAQCVVHYRDKQQKVTRFIGNLYDASGKFVRKIKSSEIQDMATDDGFSIATDSRAKIAEMMYGQYPFTVEYEYEVEGKGVFPVEVWQAQPKSSVSVENATYDLQLPSSETAHFKAFNLEKSEPQVVGAAGGKSYRWSAKNVAAGTEEAFSSDKTITAPMVYVSWENFIYEGHTGAAHSWSAFGQFFNKLNQGRDVLPDAFKAELQTLVKDCPTPLSKIEKIYSFLQKNTRYVSIQFGIGGFQPFPASDVCAKKYGDCKALTNFTKAMLQEVGVRSHYTLVCAGDDAMPLQPNLVGNYFNHAFLCVPLEKDTVWLECTSSNGPAGYCGDFTGDRDVLILTENGGQIVHTPRYSEKDNRQMRSATVKMDADGNAATDLTTLYTGLQQDAARSFATHSNEKDVRDALIRRLHLPNFDLKSFKYTADRQRIPTVEEKLSLELPHYGSKSGKRLFVQPNIFSKFSFTMPDTMAKKARQLTVVANDMAYTDSDSLIFDLPEGFAMEHTPEPTTLNSPFGSYAMACRLDGKRLFYTRKLVLNNSEQPKESLGILLDFMRNIEKADKMKLVLVAK
jgi:hypothetical protein